MKILTEADLSDSTDDQGFSQELLQHSESDSTASNVDCPSEHDVIDAEVQSLHVSLTCSVPSNATDAINTVIEDYWASLFADYVGETLHTTI